MLDCVVLIPAELEKCFWIYLFLYAITEAEKIAQVAKIRFQQKVMEKERRKVSYTEDGLPEEILMKIMDMT